MMTSKIFQFGSITILVCLMSSALGQPKCDAPGTQLGDDEVTCECKNGTKGDPGFFCSEQIYKYCSILDTSTIRMFGESVTAYVYPCPQVIAELKTTIDDRPHKMDVLVSGKFNLATGNMYLERYRIVDGDIRLDMIGGALYKDGQMADDTFIQQHEEYFYQIKGGWALATENFNVVIYPEANNTEEQVTGLMVSYNKDKDVREINEICSTRQVEIEDGIENDGYADKDIFQIVTGMRAYESLRDEHRFCHEEICETCNKLEMSINKCRYRDRVATLNKCGPILTDSAIRKCVSEFDTSPFDLFAECVEAYCDKSDKSCALVNDSATAKHCYPNIPEC